jgi:hypothetical protein
MKNPRAVNDFPKRGNHIGDLISLPSGQVYRWCEFKRWQRWNIAEMEGEKE